MRELEVMKLAEGLWRWTAPHPEWTPAKDRPGGWGRMVGCLYLETPGGAEGGIVLIDPLAPPQGTEDARRFWEALDRDVARIDRPVLILLGNHFHQRNAQAFLDRYRGGPGASLLASEKALPLLSCEVTRTFGDGEPLPGGLMAHAIPALECPGETVFHDPFHRALICADVLVGAGEGRVRVPPHFWAEGTPEGQERYKTRLRGYLRNLSELDFDRVLVSHGEPVLSHGRAALLEAVDAPAWGEE